MKAKILKLLTVIMLLSIIALPVSAGNISNPFNRTGAKFSLQSSDLTVAGVPRVVADVGPASLKPGTESADESQIYLIRFQEPALASYTGGINGLAPTSPQITGERELDAQSTASQAYVDYLEARHEAFRSTLENRLGREVAFVYEYFAANNGVALSLTAEEATLVAGLPEVAYIEPDREQQLHTDNGPAWIGAPSIWDGTATGGLPGTMGEGIVVGVIDTGINPSNPSFADIGDDGYDHSNPRGNNNYVGVCNPAEPTYDPTFPCNDKLIGAWGFSSVNGGDPRDYDGHGSHTASTAAGNVLDEATVIGPTLTVTRTISGVAPHANVIAYAACCTNSALSAAIDQIIFDNVDVVNYSIGSIGCTATPDMWSDFSTVGFLNARAAGTFVANSAGNCGPGAATVGSPADAPWLTSVAASTHDRKLVNALVDMSGGDTNPPADISGKSLTSGYGPAPIVYAGDFPNANDPTGDPEQCLEPYPAGTWTNGEIVVCDRGTIARVDKGANVLAGGAGGLVLANDPASADSLNGDAHFLPAVHITYDDGVVLKEWLDDGGTGHTATIAGTTMDVGDDNADILAAFSSRGANKALADILVPSVAAPGVDILAAAGTGDSVAWGFISGTSMSSPHVAGVGALMMSLHPTWSPAEIQSALMTTGYTSLLKEDGATAADPFDMGSGRVDLTQAGEAGLVMNETLADYWNANPAMGGDPATLNLASFGDGSCYQECGWTRSFRSALGVESTWEISATAASPDMEITLSDTGVTVAAGGTFSLDVDVDVIQLAPESWHFGEVVLTETNDAAPDAHLPIAVYVSSSTDLAVLSKVVDKSEAVVGSTLTYSITLQNPVPVSNTYTITDTIPSNATYVDGSATGGLVYDEPTETLTWTGELGPSGLNIAETNITGYVSLAAFVPPFTLPSNADDGGFVLTGLDFFYMGEHYNSVIWSVNGTVEAGAASGLATGGANHTIPDPEPPNNLLAPWWTDLDLTTAGNWYVAGLTDGVNNYTVFEWEDVPKFGDLSSTATFQLWIQDGTDNIWFAYDGFTGDTSTATVGAEDSTGSSGALYYFDGAGTLPSSANDLLVEFFLSDPAEFSFQVVASGGLDELDVLNVVTATDGENEFAAWAFTDIEALKIYLPLIFK